MEYIVYVPRGRKLEAISNWGHHVDNVKGSLMFGGKFRRLIREIKVGRLQPDLVTRFVFRHGDFSVVCDDVYCHPGPGTVLFHALEVCFCCFAIGGDLLIGGE